MHLSSQVPHEADFATSLAERPCCFVGPNLLACQTGKRCITLVDVEEATRAVKQLTWQPTDEQLLDLDEAEFFAVLAAHPSRQQRLLSAAGWGMIKVWNVDTGLCTTTLNGFYFCARDALWAGDSNVVAIGLSSDILRWDLGGGGCVPLPDLKFGRRWKSGGALACSANGNLVAANDLGTCYVLLWDTRTDNEVTQVFEDRGGGRYDGHCAVALDGTGRIAASMDSETGTLRTWDIRTRRLLARVGGLCEGDDASLTLNDSGTAALCCTAGAFDGDDQGSRGGVYDLVLGRWASSWQWMDWQGKPKGICCTRDFGSLALWHEDGSASVWRPSLM